MTTRQTIPLPSDPEVDQLPNGFDGSNAPSTFVVPPCGIEDVDKSVFNLFDKELGFVTSVAVNGTNAPANIRRPTVIFATGERFAVVKKLRPVRDRNGALMLPAISIRRTSIEQTPQDMTARGMNQTTGELIIKRRLDPSDRDYQVLVNKLLLQNQDTNTPTTRRSVGENNADLSIQQGMFLDPKLGNNVIEVIAIPQPQFYTAVYEVVFWASFTTHMNYMIETLFTSQLPQGKTFKLVTDKGYWFIAMVDDAVSSQDNVEDFTEQERILRHSFTLRVPAFMLGTNGPGRPVPVKRYLSAVNIAFELAADEPATLKDLARVDFRDDSTFALTDVLADPTQAQALTSQDHLAFRREFFNQRTGKPHVGYVKIVERNGKKGETLYTASDLDTLGDFMAHPNPQQP